MLRILVNIAYEISMIVVMWLLELPVDFLNGVQRYFMKQTYTHEYL